METDETKTVEDKQYTDSEVSEIILTQQKIYALDDARACQITLNRPASFVQPLEEIRSDLHARMVYLTTKKETSPSKNTKD